MAAPMSPAIVAAELLMRQFLVNPVFPAHGASSELHAALLLLMPNMNSSAIRDMFLVASHNQAHARVSASGAEQMAEFEAALCMADSSVQQQAALVELSLRVAGYVREVIEFAGSREERCSLIRQRALQLPDKIDGHDDQHLYKQLLPRVFLVGDLQALGVHVDVGLLVLAAPPSTHGRIFAAMFARFLELQKPPRATWGAILEQVNPSHCRLKCLDMLMDAATPGGRVCVLASWPCSEDVAFMVEMRSVLDPANCMQFTCFAFSQMVPAVDSSPAINNTSVDDWTRWYQPVLDAGHPVTPRETCAVIHSLGFIDDSLGTAIQCRDPLHMELIKAEIYSHNRSFLQLRARTAVALSKENVVAGVDDAAAAAGQHSSCCKICLENQVKICFVPCGHAVVCFSCLKQMHAPKQCPICRAPVSRAQPLFL